MDLKRWLHTVLSILILAASQPAGLPIASADGGELRPVEPVQSEAPTGANLIFNVTVGLDPFACASGDSLTVGAGAVVYFCYTAKNTGDEILVRHTLMDSQLGSLLNYFDFDLLPSASVFITASATIASPVINTASWTSFTSGNALVNLLDSARVFVADAGLALNKTVGTDPNACGANDSITVPAGTKVTYCYSAHNTGTENLVSHSLVDDQLGTVLSNLGYLLSPGASVFITQTAIASLATINSATWTARTAGNVPISATDTAKVSIAAGASASLSIEKTAGTDANICAVTDSITVLTGTKVTYCYHVKNTGSQTLTTHDVMDDQLGALLTNFAYPLAPGASVFFTETIIANSNVINTATWTARTAGGVVASELDSATVVVSPELPSLLLKKTVGTDPNACATSDSISVPVGTRVFYCYGVTNTGPQNLVAHDLFDDHLGTILNGLAYNLLPGASVFITQSVTLNSNVTNIATWTGHTASAAAAVDTDQAQIIVPGGLNFRLYLPEILK